MMHAEAGRAGRGMVATWAWRGAQRLSRKWPTERYAGEAVLRDLAVSAGDAETAERIVARFAAARAVARTLEGGTEAALRAERNAAAEHVARMKAGDAERRALESAITTLERGAARPLATSLLTAASCAMTARHREGAVALYSLAWRVARHAGAAREAARAARAIERAARAAGVYRAVRLWHRRATVHDAARTD
jgi:hypothetical protein